MQQSSLPLTLRQRLIDAVDESYHVKDMGTIVEVLGMLEQLSVTKELLETTRLGRTVNEFRKQVDNDKLAKRAKSLVKKWRSEVLTTTTTTGPSNLPAQAPLNGNSDLDVSLTNHTGPTANHTGYSSNSSSPKLMPSSISNSKVSPNAIYNSNSLSPRILSNLTTNNNNNLSRNGQSQILNLNRSSLPLIVSSPGLSSSSPSLPVSSPLPYGSKLKSPFGPTSSPQTQLSNKTSLSNTNSYAPNVEVVARTNAANKRLRIEDAGGPGANVGPPSKKARKITNGGILEGTLDDPSIVLLDDLSKDSITSRTSDNSDGSSSKPVSYISSGAVLSAAPSPLSVNLDSTAASPMSLGGGICIESSEALISHDKTSLMENETSAADVGAIANDQPQDVFTELLQPQPLKRGRKKKQKDVMNAETLLHQQIAQARQENKIRTVHRLSMDVFDDDHNHPSDSEYLRKPHSQSTALSREDPVMKNEIVEKYLQSQNELRTKMERQYQDAVKRNEIPLIPDQPSPSPPTPGDELDPKKKKKKDKKKNREGSDNLGLQHLPSESEILSRLPPIDPQILEELKNFQFYVPSETPEAKSKPEIETEIPTSLTTNDTNTEVKNSEGLLVSKIDWGDSDDEEDQVATQLFSASAKVDDIDATRHIVVDGDFNTSLPTDDITASIAMDMSNLDDEEEAHPKEIQQSDVDRFHLEKVENLNGNVDKDGVFKEWHEVLTVESFKGDLLHILPYTIIDF